MALPTQRLVAIPSVRPAPIAVQPSRHVDPWHPDDGALTPLTSVVMHVVQQLTGQVVSGSGRVYGWLAAAGRREGAGAGIEPLAAGDPRQVGVFRLCFQLGVGGMGRVFLGFSPAGRAVAVKVVHPELARDPEFVSRFRREVRAAEAVSGAYTAPVVAAGRDDDPPWLATAFVAGPVAGRRGRAGRSAVGSGSVETGWRPDRGDTGGACPRLGASGLESGQCAAGG